MMENPMKGISYKANLNRVTLGGGYSDDPVIIIDATYVYGTYEVAAIYEDGEELDSYSVDTEQEALEIFDKLVYKYAGDLQKAFYKKLEVGKRYTIVCFDDYGNPTARKITFLDAEFCTYAQFSDVIRFTYREYKHKNIDYEYIRHKSVLVFKGWQNLEKSDSYELIRDNDTTQMYRAKYACFNAQYIEDMEHKFKNPVIIYKAYKTGVNGKLYA